MIFTCQSLEKLEAAMAMVEQAKEACRKEEEEKIVEFEAKGWARIEYLSEYCGSHSEYGYHDVACTVMVRPERAGPLIKMVGHKGRFFPFIQNHREDNEWFWEIIKGLDDNDFVIVGDDPCLE